MLLTSIDVVLWAIAQRTPITRERIIARWGVCRATSYRWLQPLEEARQRAALIRHPTRPSYRRPGGTRVLIAPPRYIDQGAAR